MTLAGSEREMAFARVLLDDVRRELDQLSMTTQQRALLQQKLAHAWQHFSRAIELQNGGKS